MEIIALVAIGGIATLAIIYIAIRVAADDHWDE